MKPTAVSATMIGAPRTMEASSRKTPRKPMVRLDMAMDRFFAVFALLVEIGDQRRADRIEQELNGQQQRAEADGHFRRPDGELDGRPPDLLVHAVGAQGVAECAPGDRGEE